MFFVEMQIKISNHKDFHKIPKKKLKSMKGQLQLKSVFISWKKFVFINIFNSLIADWSYISYRIQIKEYNRILETQINGSINRMNKFLPQTKWKKWNEEDKTNYIYSQFRSYFGIWLIWFIESNQFALHLRCEWFESVFAFHFHKSTENLKKISTKNFQVVSQNQKV